MASGFEAAGLALALFPILVKGIEIYVEERGVIRDFFHYRSVLKRHIRDLGREHVSFRNSCQRFQEDIALRSDLPATAIEEMVQDLEDPRWKEGDWLHPGIMDLESVQRYIETVDDMREELSKIGEWIGIHENESPELLDKKTRRRQWKKLILVIRQDTIAQHLATANRLNTFLARLTDQTSPMAPTPRSRRKAARHYKRVRNHAIDLYHTLNTKFPTPPSCGCELNHEVNIRLQYLRAKRGEKSTSFHTIFTLAARGHSHYPSTLWREFELEDWPSNEAEHGLFSQENIPRGDRSGKNPSKKVGFAILNTTHNPNAIKFKCTEIQDLCIFINKSKASTEWLGFITDGQKRKHRLRDIHQMQVIRTSNERPPTISLAQALLKHQPPSREFRSKLSLKLASSVMQLHSTEWLPNTWSSENIYFLETPGNGFNITDPLVQRSFGSPCQTHYEERNGVQSIKRSDPCLFMLGIVLIELWQWKPFSQLKTAEETAMFSNVCFKPGR